MTLQELYEWGKKNNLLEREVYVGWQDGGGYYNGSSPVEETLIEVAEDKIEFARSQLYKTFTYEPLDKPALLCYNT